MGREFERVGSEYVLDTPIFKVRMDRALHPETGREGRYVALEMHDFVNMVAETTDGGVLMVRQWRHGVRSIELELPAGLVDPGEDALVAAKRELREETGYASDSWQSIGEVAPNPAYQANRCSTFWAQNCTKVGEPDLDPGEDIELVTVRADEIVTMVRNGTLRSAQMVAAVLWWLDARAQISW